MSLRNFVIPIVAFWACLWLGLMSAARAEDGAVDSQGKKAVTLHETLVFYLYRGDDARSLSDRAQRASQALSLAARTNGDGEADVRIDYKGDIATILVGSTPIVELRPEDARMAGDSTLEVHASSVAARVAKAIESERQRVSLANFVFSISLVVFFGLVTLYLLGRVTDFTRRARRYVTLHPDKIPALRLQSLDVVGSASVRNGALVLLSLTRWLSLLGLAYAWLVLSLSLFDSTRPYTEKLTGIVLSPLTALVGRMASSLPMFAIVLAAAGLVAVLVRFSDLFFYSVERGETEVGWLTRDTAAAASLITRVAIVLFALVIVGPVITGDPNGALSRLGMVVVIALAVAATPALASVIAGIMVIFSRTLGTGDLVEYGGERGFVREMGLVSLCLVTEGGVTIRVPHARSLWHATRILERRQR